MTPPHPDPQRTKVDISMDRKRRHAGRLFSFLWGDGGGDGGTSPRNQETRFPSARSRCVPFRDYIRKNQFQSLRIRGSHGMIIGTIFPKAAMLQPCFRLFLTINRYGLYYQQFIPRRQMLPGPLWVTIQRAFLCSNPVTMNRTTFLIDGFNLYHSLTDACRNLRCDGIKWLNIRKLCASYLPHITPGRPWKKFTISPHLRTIVKTEILVLFSVINFLSNV